MLGFIKQFVIGLVLLMPVAVLADSQSGYDKALADWTSVLETFVDDQGRTDFIALAKQPDALKAYVDFVSQVGPNNDPLLFLSRESVLAYHLNTYNALAMHGVIDEGLPADFDSFFKRLSFFKLRDVVIGGEATSLYDYENDVIRPLVEPRVHFALNCMVKDCPRLPRKAFNPEQLEADLAALTREFFNKDKHLRVDADNETVYVSEILDFYTEDFVASGDEQDLIPYINQYGEIPIPDHYRVEFIDYDWTINQQP